MNKAANIILDRYPSSSASEALQILGWNTLAKRRIYHRCIYVCKSLHQLLDDNCNFKCGSYNTRGEKKAISFLYQYRIIKIELFVYQRLEHSSQKYN